MKVHIIEAIEVMRNGTGKLRDEYANRIEAHGIEQGGEPVAWMNADGFLTHYKQGDATIPLYTAPPSIDALIAEIDSVDNYLSIQVILNKYRGQKQ